MLERVWIRPGVLPSHDGRTGISIEDAQQQEDSPVSRISHLISPAAGYYVRDERRG